MQTHLKPTIQARGMTYIEVKGEWKYLYRAVDSLGFTLDFMRASGMRERQTFSARQ